MIKMNIRNLFEFGKEIIDKPIINKWITNRELLFWKPRNINDRYEEDILLEQKIYNVKFTDLANKELPLYFNLFNDLAKKSEKIINNAPSDFPTNLSFGLFVLCYINDKWILPKYDKIISNNSIIEKNYDLIIDFLYYLKFIYYYLNINVKALKVNLNNYPKFENVLDNINKLVKKYNQNKNQYFIILNQNNRNYKYTSYEVLIDTGSPRNFISLSLARYLRAEFVNKFDAVGGFTSIQTNVINIIPVVSIKTIVLNKEINSGKIKKWTGHLEYGVLPLMNGKLVDSGFKIGNKKGKGLIDYHILVGKDFLDAIGSVGIKTIIQ